MKNQASLVGDLSPLSKWAPELAEALVSLTSDIALVIRADGTIEKVVQSGSSPFSATASEWVGRAFADTVTGDTRVKIETLLKEVAETGVGRRREVNHPATPGNVMNSIPVAYTALQLGTGGPLLAVGRDLRAIAAIQQRFLDVQRETEKVYWRARQAASRDQLLLQAASDAMLLVDSETQRITEANEAAAKLFELPVSELLGRSASLGFDRHSAALLDEQLAASRASGKQPEVRVRLQGKLVYTTVSMTPFRTEDRVDVLLRVRREHRPEEDGLQARLADGPMVLTDSGGRILAANGSFCALLAAGPEDQLRGRLLREWFGEPMDGQLQAVRHGGLVRFPGASLLTHGGRKVLVELTGFVLSDDDQERVAFTVVPHPGRVTGLELAASDPRAALGEVLGGGTLAMMLERAEALLIAATLEGNGGDVAASALVLGISPAELERRRWRAAEQTGPPPAGMTP